MPRDSDKSKGILAVLEHFGWKPENVMAIGDAPNDMEMLEFAGVSIAMGNAKQEVKDVADFVTKTVDQDGWAFAMKTYELID
jgi:hydroxymethylpyrimidine pyrophosphatase-like HAD family hydrolase